MCVPEITFTLISLKAINNGNLDCSYCLHPKHVFIQFIVYSQLLGVTIMDKIRNEYIIGTVQVWRFGENTRG